MESFKDNTGKSWTFEINVGTIKRVRAECGIDLANMIKIGENGVDTSAMEKMVDDPCLLFSVIYSILKDEVEKSGLSENDFLERFCSDEIQNAVDSVVREIINFTHPLKRKMLLTLFEKTREYQKKTEAKIEKIMESEEFEKELDEMLSKQLTNSQESSE